MVSKNRYKNNNLTEGSRTRLVKKTVQCYTWARKTDWCSMISFATPLIQIRGIGPKYLRKLKVLNIETVRDLIFHLPFRYEDFSKVIPIAELGGNEQATIRGMVQQVSVKQTWRKKMFITEATVQDDTGAVRAVWFNQPFIASILRQGSTVNLAGKVGFDADDLYLSNPVYELMTGERSVEPRHTARLVPVYPETKGLTSKALRFIVKPILESLERIPDPIPKDILRRTTLPELNAAIQAIHFPANIEDAELAKRRFAFEELFLVQLINIGEKVKLEKEKAIAIQWTPERVKAIIGDLPFELTMAQKRSLYEILKDTERGIPMNRLLEGDVGSGKTVVTAIIALLAAENGYQAAFMAPTEVLALQHFKTISELFKNTEVGIALCTASQQRLCFSGMNTTPGKPHVLKEIEKGSARIIIGTHAIIQDKITFKKIALAVIDEQHRFGVSQRAKLARDWKKNQKAKTSYHPHLLSMSATPIPRTLSLALFGDLNISMIDELPKGRREIITKIVTPAERLATYEFMRKEVSAGRQIFIICPLIEDSIHLEAKSVTEEYNRLKTSVFPDLALAALHGQMKPKEKERIMNDFREKKSHVLVSTSVIEVGVDVPNATIMVIEGADRFGLAQLYQFRGRVGRGDHQSYCLLFTDSESVTTHRRLKALLTAKNGFELAQKDLEIRGPGEFLGTKQSGVPDLAMKALKNLDLVKTAREEAVRLIKKDNNLAQYPLLRTKVEELRKRVYQE